MRTLQVLTLVLVFTAIPALADRYAIVGTVGFSNIDGTLPSEPTINAGDRWYGTLSTEGICEVCYAGNGAQLEFTLNIFGEYQSPVDADFISGVTFTPSTLSLNFFDSEGSPSVEILGNSFDLWWGGPNPVPSVPIAYGGVDISKIPEPSTLLLLGTAVGFCCRLRRNTAWS